MALNLKTILEAITDPDKFAKRGIFRVLNMLARIAHFRSHWIEALELWDQAKKALEVLGQQDHLQMGLVQYAIAYALMKIGNYQSAGRPLGRVKVCWKVRSAGIGLLAWSFIGMVILSSA